MNARTEKVLENVLEHGGLDAIVYLCSVVHGFELHALATKSLAALSDHRKCKLCITFFFTHGTLARQC